MSKKVYVVTNAELGWDCIVGVYDPENVTEEQLEKSYPREDLYFIFEREVETEIYD